MSEVSGGSPYGATTIAGRDGSVTVRQDVAVYAISLAEGSPIRHDLDANRHAWVQVLRGRAEVNRATLASGDGAALSGEVALELSSAEAAQLLLFDLG